MIMSELETKARNCILIEIPIKLWVAEADLNLCSNLNTATATRRISFLSESFSINISELQRTQSAEEILGVHTWEYTYAFQKIDNRSG